MKTGIRSTVIAWNRWLNKSFSQASRQQQRAIPPKSWVCGGRLPFCKNAITTERIWLRCHSGLWCLLFHKPSRSCQNADATSGRVESERNIRGTLQERLSRFLHNRSIWRPQIFAKWTRSRSSLPSSDEWMSAGILSGFYQLKTDCKQRGSNRILAVSSSRRCLGCHWFVFGKPGLHGEHRNIKKCHACWLFALKFIDFLLWLKIPKSTKPDQTVTSGHEIIAWLHLVTPFERVCYIFFKTNFLLVLVVLQAPIPAIYFFLEQLQNAGPLLTIHQTSQLVWLSSGKICMSVLSVEFIYLVARLACQWMKKRGIHCMMLSIQFIHLATRLAC